MIRWLLKLRQRRLVRKAFGAYLSPEVLEKLSEDPGSLELGVDTKDASVLICTIAGLVARTAELRNDPPAVATLFNRIFTPCMDVIVRTDGVVDTFVIDRISGFWGVPQPEADHPAKACTAAILIQQALVQLDAELRDEAAARGTSAPPLEFGIGANSGSVAAGNIGGRQRILYTVVGDPVLLADSFSRAGRFYGTPVIVGAETARQVPDFATLKVDVVRIVGRPEPEHIHTVVGTPDVAKSAEFQALHDLHQRMLAAYGGRRWDEAAALVHECKAKERWGLVKLYDMYAERIASGAVSPSAAP